MEESILSRAKISSNCIICSEKRLLLLIRWRNTCYRKRSGRFRIHSFVQ